MPCLPFTRRHIARTHFVAFSLAMGLSTLVEPAYAQLSTGCQDINGNSNRSYSHRWTFFSVTATPENRVGQLAQQSRVLPLT